MQGSSTRTVLGIVLIVLGFLFIADNFFIIPFHISRFVISWPVILMIVGIIIVANSRNNTFGYILICVGLIWLISRYTHIPFNILFRNYWPIILIIIGLLILFHRKEPSYSTGHPGTSAGAAHSISEDYIDESAIFSSTTKKVMSKNFLGGKLTCIFGGIDLDLREAELAKGSSTLDIFTLFGGTDIIASNNQKIIVSITSIFGGFDDKRYFVKDAGTDEDRVLVLKGMVIFGGGDLKNT